ncbi:TRANSMEMBRANE PROTEIN [Salix koriyanagi]|uniref:TRANSMEMBRANE PROTEIN n=1 Tax=Salix koriyanagi TaxID=2511006 RepID=A0A9Q0PMN3_9ROSI|nr:TRANSMEMBRANE PROTEIN [Salix koriyanagi]
MVKLLSPYMDVSMWKLSPSSSVSESGLKEIQPVNTFQAPTFAQSVYPLLLDLHNIFIDLPSIGRALAFAQKMLDDVNRGEAVDTQIISEVHTTPVPPEVKDLVGKLVTNCESDGEVRNHDEKRRLLSNKPMVAVGAGATTIFGASSVSKVVHASTFMKVATFKFPTSLKLLLIQTQKIMAISMGKTLGPTKLLAPGLVNSGANATSALKAAASAEKIRTVVHSVIASAEKTSFSTMRTAFFEIMRQRQVQSIGVLPWATFGCSVATCSALLMYGDGIKCAVESLPAAPSIASLGRGIQSLHQASQVVGQTDGTRIQKSIESLMNRLRKVKMQ